ncbi:MAG: O-acetyl-ADP-ribose deacetylase [Bacteroidota bacterium]
MKTIIQVVQGDITRFDSNIIVNAANSSLLGGGGVDGAIHRAGGPDILEACRKIRARQGGCKTGEAVITPAGRLPAQYVIHTVGPVWQEAQAEKNKRLLESCYQKSLELGLAHGARSIAFPNISTGIYRFPKELAASVAYKTVQRFVQNQPDGYEVVTFVCYDKQNAHIYQRLIAEN